MDFTLSTSLLETYTLTPLQYGVHRWASNGNKAHVKQILQLAAVPVDHIIQAIAMPIFTLVDHVRDIAKDFKKDTQGKSHSMKGAVKIISSLVTLPLKEIAALTVSAGFVFSAAINTVLPFTAIYRIYQGKKGADFYFYHLDEVKSLSNRSIKTLIPLPSYQVLNNSYENKLEELRQAHRVAFDTRKTQLEDLLADIQRNIEYGDSNEYQQRITEEVTNLIAREAPENISLKDAKKSLIPFTDIVKKEPLCDQDPNLYNTSLIIWREINTKLRELGPVEDIATENNIAGIKGKLNEMALLIKQKEQLERLQTICINYERSFDGKNDNEIKGYCIQNYGLISAVSITVFAALVVTSPITIIPLTIAPHIYIACS